MDAVETSEVSESKLSNDSNDSELWERSSSPFVTIVVVVSKVAKICWFKVEDSLLPAAKSSIPGTSRSRAISNTYSSELDTPVLGTRVCGSR